MEGLLMSFVVTAPEFVVNAAGDLANIGSAITAANGAAAAPTTAVAAAAGDEVSVAIASLFLQPRPGVSGAQCAGGGVSRRVRAGAERRGGHVRGGGGG